ncbi:CDP-glycerol glycerophosphotransferase family protein [Cohnella fermenti]|uniref:CDP-glycerol--glycerophosphate glycerophosphotransferase n=1 Tax=Cohnella fermenti TaxID=2565925 RepID=A0A4V6RXM3_9BACL|nr:CDP-glycerol glycerophosphotransferase family protein [Cohnella fermenti]THF80792.1 hypothetical protein E6C55_09925 [Cohnella fermenti]
MKQQTIIIFGTGSSAESFYRNLNASNVKVAAFLDNDSAKWTTTKFGIPVREVHYICKIEFDHIVIASQFVEPIFQQLMELGVPFERIVPLYPYYFTQYLHERYKATLGTLLLPPHSKKKKAIGLLSTSNSGCNCIALFKGMPCAIREKYDVRLITSENDEGDTESFDVFVSTHRNHSLGRAKNIELWHGFPLKAMGRMHRSSASKDMASAEVWQEADAIASYSPLYSTLMSACFPTTVRQYQITGMPRNDLLLGSDGRSNLERIVGKSLEHKKLLLYMPTFRVFSSREAVEGKRNLDNLFGFSDFQEEAFHAYLQEHNLFLIVKLHEFEKHIQNNLEKFQSEHVFLLKSGYLVQEGLDLYELINGVDLLLTDYSSVFFDYLLLNRPIVFVTNDLTEYQADRGFLLSPYDSWTPGPKVNSQSFLEMEIINSLDRDPYESERAALLPMIHTYQDAKSSERIWSMIEQFL